MAEGNSAGGGGGGVSGGGGLGDILSMALFQTGVDSMTPAQISVDSSSILNAAANTLDSSLLSTDISVLTAGLFSTLAKENAIKRTNSTNTTATTAQSPAVSAESKVPNETSTVYSSGANESYNSGAAPHPLTLVARPPSESEVKTAQLLKAELQNPAIDDDIDLDELLGGGDSTSVGGIDELSLFTGAVGSSSSLTSVPSDPFLFTATPPLSGVGSATTQDPFSSLLGALGPATSAPTASRDTPPSKPTVVKVSAPPTRSVSQTKTLATSSSSVSLTKATNSTATLSSAPNSPVPPAPITSTTVTGITKITRTAAPPPSQPPAKRPVLSTTKLDLAAILREVTKMAPITVTTSPLTSTVSVTVVPPSAVLGTGGVAGGGVTARRLISLPRGVSVVARALQRYICMCVCINHS